MGEARSNRRNRVGIGMAKGPCKCDKTGDACWCGRRYKDKARNDNFDFNSGEDASGELTTQVNKDAKEKHLARKGKMNE